MYIEFEELQDTARVWVYQADTALSEEQSQHALKVMQSFITQWSAHGAGLKASVQIFHNRFLVIGLEEAYHEASGCSIDASVGTIRKLEEEFNVSFFDRLNMVVQEEGILKSRALKEIKSALKNGEMNPETLVFDNTIQSKEALHTKWLIPVGKTWLGRYYESKVG